MSDDLISRKALEERLNYYLQHTNKDQPEHYAYGKALKEVNEAPTAFDKEKVMEELKDMANAAWKNTGNKFCNSDMAIARYRALEDALNIIYKGGME